MRPTLALLAVSFLSTTSLAAEPVPVLVELFTSEGCSSCPPADAALAELTRSQPVAGAHVIALGFHVDYWNDLGWADPFSSATFSDRQRSYAPQLDESRVYTPQMVVDGARGFVGELSTAKEAVAAAARAPKARLTLAVSDGNRATVRVEDGSPSGRLWLAVTEDGLSSAVARGENRGRTLRHAAVVRALIDLGGASAAKTVDLPLDPRWKHENLRVVAWLQEDGSSRVGGIAEASLRR